MLLVLIVEMDIAHGFMATTDLTSGQWLACVAIGSAILWAGELVKIILRARDPRRPQTQFGTAPTGVGVSAAGTPTPPPQTLDRARPVSARRR